MLKLCIRQGRKSKGYLSYGKMAKICQGLWPLPGWWQIQIVDMAYHGSCHIILYGYGMRKVLTIDWVHATISTLLRRHANIMTLELVVKLKLIVSDTSFHWVKQMLLFLQPHFTAYFIVAGAGTSQALIRLRLQPAAVIFTWKHLQYSSEHCVTET